MKPYPRIRKTIKWGGLSASVLLVIVCVASFWLWISLNSPHSRAAILTGGVLIVSRYHHPPFALGHAWNVVVEPTAFHVLWDFQFLNTGPYWLIRVPVWLLIAVCAVPTSIAWHLDSCAARRVSIGTCPACRYNRTGLPLGAVCPECGTVAPKAGTAPSSQP